MAEQRKDKAMKLFLNCEKPDVLEKYLELYPIVAGVTTNPAMIASAGGVDFFEHLKKIRKVIGTRILMAQVTSPGYKEMVEEAELIRAAGGENTYVKIPAVEEGIRAMEIISKKGIDITATVVASFIQGAVALCAGAKYAAVFYGPMEDAGFHSDETIEQLNAFIKTSGCKGEIMAAGCKNMPLCGRAVKAGAHAVTVNPDALSQGMDAPVAERSMKLFKREWEAAYGKGVHIIDMKQK
jgi:transaldolase